MLFFSSRAKARSFASIANKKLIDLGSSAPVGRRWAVKVLIK